MTNASALLVALPFYAVAAALFAWPLYSVWRLVLRAWRGTPLPSGGIFGFYVGGLPWTVVVWYQAALHPALKPLMPAPFLVCGVLAAVWGKLMDPPRSGLSSTGDMLALWFFGLMSFTVCGGGYFDKMIVVSHAMGRLNEAKVDAGDPAALARVLDGGDPELRLGAALALQRLDASRPETREALTWALVDPDERVAEVGARVFSNWDGKGAVPAPSVLGPLLDSADAASRERAEKALDRLSPAGKKAALDEVARWRETAAPARSVYYAHPLSIYDKPQEAADVETLTKAGYRVDNPNDPAVEARFQASKDFKVFTDLAAGADAVAVRAFPDGKLGAGVAKEALAGLERGKRVFEVRDGGPEAFHPLSAEEVRARALTIEQTREALKRCGVVERIEY